MVPLPSLSSWLVDKSGRLLNPWISFLQQFVQAPPAFASVTVGASPFAYEAAEPGTLAITGGTVSDVSLTRGTDTISFGSIKTISVAINDTVTITYSVLPTVQFIPSYGQNTTS